MRSSHITLIALASYVGTFGAGCFGPRSEVDSKAGVTLSGVVQTEDGSTPSSTTVKLIRHPDALQVIGQLFVTVGSLGLACVTGQADICSAFEESKSGSDGAYHFGLRGGDTQGSTGEALMFTAFASCGAALGNCAVASDFRIQRTELTIPPLRQWSTKGSLAADGNGDSVINWPALESNVGGGAADKYQVSITTPQGVLLWMQDAGTSETTTIDRRVTQNLAGRWTVIAERKQPGDGTDFDMRWYAPQQDYPNQNLVPLSRSADCYAQGADGSPMMLARPCPLTDGDPTSKFVPLSAPPCPSGQTCQPQTLNNWIFIDLGLSHPLAEIVLYDVAVSTSNAMLLVETSDDMTTWVPQATLAAKPYQTAALTGSARYVRLHLSDPKAQFTGSGNSEVAIYAPF